MVKKLLALVAAACLALSLAACGSSGTSLPSLTLPGSESSAVSGGDLAPALEEPAACLENPAEGHLRLLPKPDRPSRCREGRQTRKAHLQRAAVVLDLCASIAVVALSVAALAAFLAL